MLRLTISALLFAGLSMTVNAQDVYFPTDITTSPISPNNEGRCHAYYGNARSCTRVPTRKSLEETIARSESGISARQAADRELLIQLLRAADERIARLEKTVASLEERLEDVGKKQQKQER